MELAALPTYDLDELLGTKLRALYQRRKGRDLFDIATAISRRAVDPARIVAAFRRYMDEGGHHVTRAELEENLAAKLKDKRFLSDLPPLLAAGQIWNAAQAAALVVERLCPLLP
jgi:predicted nucleotidyltransferase component of viral defense system